MKNINIKYIILILFLFNFNIGLSKKLYTLKYYENNDCTGTIYLYQVLLTVKDYLFQLPTINDYYTLNCTGNFESSDAPCYLEGYYYCTNNPNNCREYVYLNQCKDGRKLVIEKLDYLENDYCTCTETTRTHNFIDEEIAWEGVQIIRRNYCHLGLTLDCNYLEFKLTACETGELVFLTNGSKKYIESSNLTPPNATKSETLMVTYRPNDPDYYKNTLMTRRIPQDQQLYLNMLTDEQLSYIRQPNAIL